MPHSTTNENNYQNNSNHHADLNVFVIIGSINWANRKLPYDGNLATATLRHIGRIVLRDGNRELAQIYDVQITCEWH